MILDGVIFSVVDLGTFGGVFVDVRLFLFGKAEVDFWEGVQGTISQRRLERFKRVCEWNGLHSAT